MGYKENKAKYEPIARKFATKYGIDPDLFAAQIEQESGWKPEARSRVGAQGIAQIMPATAKEWGVDVSNPIQSLEVAARKMAGYVKTNLKNKSLNPNGDYLRAHQLALASYNAGEGSLRPNKEGLPKYTGYKETRDYIDRISKAFKGSGINSRNIALGTDQKLSLDKLGNKLSLGTGYDPLNSNPQKQSNNKSSLYNQKSLNAVDQLSNIERSLSNMGRMGRSGNMKGLYPGSNSLYQTQRTNQKDPDLLGVNAERNYNNKISQLHSTLLGSPSTYASSYIDSEDKAEKQNNLFSNAIQSINNTWGSPSISNFNMPSFRRKEFKPFKLETEEYA